MKSKLWGWTAASLQDCTILHVQLCAFCNYMEWSRWKKENMETISKLVLCPRLTKHKNQFCWLSRLQSAARSASLVESGSLVNVEHPHTSQNFKRVMNLTDHDWLVASTPLKIMSSSIGMMTFPINLETNNPVMFQENHQPNVQTKITPCYHKWREQPLIFPSCCSRGEGCSAALVLMIGVCSLL